MTNSPNTTNPSDRKARIPLPEHLPENERSRALWIGYEASKSFPFDALIYLERSAIAGAAVLMSDSGGVFYLEPYPGSAEFEFLRGWHNGCPGAVDMVARALETNPEIRAAHEALYRLKLPH